MRRRLAGVSERDWRVLDRLLVVALIAFGWVDLATNADLEGPLWLNIAIVTAIALSFLWRRSKPLVTVLATTGGFTVMAIWLTQPPNMITAVLMLVIAAYAASRHMVGRLSVVALAIGICVIATLSIIYDPNDIFFPVTFFWIIRSIPAMTMRASARFSSGRTAKRR